VNHQGWAAFANNWVKKDGKLDVNALVGDLCGPKTMVPVMRPASYDGDPIGEMELGQFIKKHWKKNDRGAYLHQWQFTDNPAVRANLCGEGKHVPLDVLGLDLLSYYHSDEEKKTYGAHDSDYQYLFWGGEEVPPVRPRKTVAASPSPPTPPHPTPPRCTSSDGDKDAQGRRWTDHHDLGAPRGQKRVDGAPQRGAVAAHPGPRHARRGRHRQRRVPDGGPRRHVPRRPHAGGNPGHACRCVITTLSEPFLSTFT